MCRKGKGKTNGQPGGFLKRAGFSSSAFCPENNVDCFTSASEKNNQFPLASWCWTRQLRRHVQETEHTRNFNTPAKSTCKVFQGDPHQGASDLRRSGHSSSWHPGARMRLAVWAPALLRRSIALVGATDAVFPVPHSSVECDVVPKHLSKSLCNALLFVFTAVVWIGFVREAVWTSQLSLDMCVRMGKWLTCSRAFCRSH